MAKSKKSQIAVPAGISAQDLLRAVEARGILIEPSIKRLVEQGVLTITDADQKSELCFPFCFAKWPSQEPPALEYDYCGVKPATFGQTLQYLATVCHVGQEVVTTILPGAESKVLTYGPTDGRHWQLALFDLADAIANGPLEMDEEYLVIMVDAKKHRRALAD